MPSPTYSLEAGTASTYAALQAGLVQGMAGFDRERAFAELCIPKGDTGSKPYTP